MIKKSGRKRILHLRGRKWEKSCAIRGSLAPSLSLSAFLSASFCIVLVALNGGGRSPFLRIESALEHTLNREFEFCSLSKAVGDLCMQKTDCSFSIHSLRAEWEGHPELDRIFLVPRAPRRNRHHAKQSEQQAMQETSTPRHPNYHSLTFVFAFARSHCWQIVNYLWFEEFRLTIGS